MYCPIDGDEFQEGFTHCPEHDVELVDELPDDFFRAATLSWAARLKLNLLLQIAFFLLVVSACIRVVAAVSNGILYLIATFGSEGDFGRKYVIASTVESTASGILFSCLVVMAGFLVIEIFSKMAPRALRKKTRDGTTPDPLDWRDRVMRLLFALFIGFALMHIVAALVTSNAEAELRTSFGAFGGGAEPPSDLVNTMFALKYASYGGASATLGLMLAWFVYEAHGWLMGQRATSSDDS